MGRLITGFRVAVLVVLALVALTVSRIGYGGQNTNGSSTSCPVFQRTVVGDIVSGSAVSTQTIRVAPGTTITIEQVALRVDAFDTFVAPTVAAVTTSVASVASSYYLPIPRDSVPVFPAQPLTLMQTGSLHADGGTDVTLAVTIGSSNGNGRAQWSVSGKWCVAS